MRNSTFTHIGLTNLYRITPRNRQFFLRIIKGSELNSDGERHFNGCGSLSRPCTVFSGCVQFVRSSLIFAARVVARNPKPWPLCTAAVLTPQRCTPSIGPFCRLDPRPERFHGIALATCERHTREAVGRGVQLRLAPCRVMARNAHRVFLSWHGATAMS